VFNSNGLSSGFAPAHLNRSASSLNLQRVRFMKNIFSIALIFFALFFAMSTEANACWCRKDPNETNTPKKFRKVVAQTFRNSAIVFSGIVTERNGDHLKFEVKQTWKGKDQTEIFFTSTNYIDSRKDGKQEFFVDDCAYDFKVGESYLVYATIENGSFEVSKCGRTQVLADATQDIEELNLLAKKNITTRQE
jgi:hypothetical protein